MSRNRTESRNPTDHGVIYDSVKENSNQRSGFNHGLKVVQVFFLSIHCVAEEIQPGLRVWAGCMISPFSAIESLAKFLNPTVELISLRFCESLGGRCCRGLALFRRFGGNLCSKSGALFVALWAAQLD